MAAGTSDFRAAGGNIIPVEATHGPPTNSEGTGVSREEGLTLHTLTEMYTLQHAHSRSFLLSSYITYKVATTHVQHTKQAASRP